VRGAQRSLHPRNEVSGVKWHKPLSARLLPVTDKKAGDMTEFSSPYLVNIRIR